MKPNRRRFLSLLGVSTAAGPLAAKAAMDSEIAALTGLKTGSILSAGVQAVGYPAVQGGTENPYILAQQYLRFAKLPKFVEDNLKQRAATVNYLDPDIACKKSWSMCVKIQEQRERNYKNELKRYEANGTYEVAQSAFKKVTGFAWPW